jgi:hypothetical protein
MSYGGLGTLTAAPGGLPPYPSGDAYPRVFNQMAHAIDLLPTILDYAGVGVPDDPERRPDHEGRSLRRLVEDRTIEWRPYVFGHKNITNAGNQISGSSPHYIRAVNQPQPHAGAILCNVNDDCGMNADYTACINGVCSSTNCDTSAPAPSGNCPNGDSPCLNGVCVTGNECKLYNTPGNPGRCTQQLYNLTYDPTESVNLIPLIGDPDEDPFNNCRAREEELQCALVRWCMDDAKDGDLIQPRDCCVAECNSKCTDLGVTPPPPGACNGEGYLWISDNGHCWDCRPNTTTTITVTTTTTTTTTTLLCQGSLATGCTGHCPSGSCSMTIVNQALACACVAGPVGCNGALSCAQCGSAGSCPPGQGCINVFGTCVCAPQ